MRRGLLTAGITIVALAGCANTINTDVDAPPDRSTTTTAFVPEGTTAELLDQLLAEAESLSEAIVQNDGQRDIMTRIDALWTASRPAVDDVAPGLTNEFQAAIDLLRNGVDRRRPADADKATRNLRVLIDSFEPGSG